MSGVILLAFFLWLFFYIVLGIISTAVLMVVRGEFSDMGEGQWIALLICIWPILLIIGHILRYYQSYNLVSKPYVISL